MKKILIALFAHPDDESFGPSGTILLETKSGTDVHLLTLTDGASGMNPDNHPDLGRIRLSEWHAAGRIMNVSSMHHLGYNDGQLNNTDMQEIQSKGIELIHTIIAGQPADCQIEMLSNDLNGVTGHIDHIVAARAACYIFCYFKARDQRFTRLRLVCLPDRVNPLPNINWLYMESGRRPEEIDEIIDARSEQDTIRRIIRTHKTQRSDGEEHIRQQSRDLGLDYYRIIK